MKTRLAVALVVFGAFGLATAAKAEEWKDVPIVDAHCAGDVKADPDSHARSCDLQCAHYGFGMIASDGTYLKFDMAGNSKAKAALQSSTKKDHIRATVDGVRSGNTIKVKSIELS